MYKVMESLKLKAANWVKSIRGRLDDRDRELARGSRKRRLDVFREIQKRPKRGRPLLAKNVPQAFRLDEKPFGTDLPTMRERFRPYLGRVRERITDRRQRVGRGEVFLPFLNANWVAPVRTNAITQYSFDVAEGSEVRLDDLRNSIIVILESQLPRLGMTGRVSVAFEGEWYKNGMMMGGGQPQFKVQTILDMIENITTESLSNKFAGDSDLTFEVERVNIRFVNQTGGGVRSEWKKLTLRDEKNKPLMTLSSPPSKKNNCLFACLDIKKPNTDVKLWREHYAYFNSIREEFGIKPNDVIPHEQAHQIGLKYCPEYSGIYVNTIDDPIRSIIGEPYSDGSLSVMLMDNHYWRIDAKIHICNKCYRRYLNTHTCNAEDLVWMKNRFKNQDPIIRQTYEEGTEWVQEKDRLDHSKEKKDAYLKDREIIHYDIETYQDALGGEHIQHKCYIIGYTYYDAGKWVYDEFSGDNCMWEFYCFLDTLPKNVKYINAYNGSRFDHYELFRLETRDCNSKIDKDFVLANGRILRGKIHKKIQMIDLAQHTTGTLASNLKSYGCEMAKGDIDHNLSTRWETTCEGRRKEVRDYLKIDVLGLRELYEKMNSATWYKYQLNLCEFMTSASMLWYVFREGFNPVDIHLPTSTQDKLFRESIYGGRTYNNKRRFISNQYDDVMKLVDTDGVLPEGWDYESINDYVFDADVVSLYPTAMTYDFPCGKAIPVDEKWLNDPANQDTIKNKFGIYEIAYVPNPELLTPVLPRREDGKLLWDLKSYNGTYTSVDIERAKSKGYKISLLKGYYWEEKCKVFKPYIDEHYKMKQNAKKGTPQYLLAKLFLNGLYGKCIQNEISINNNVVKTLDDFNALYEKEVIKEIHPYGKKYWWTVSVDRVQDAQDKANSWYRQKPSYLGAFILSYSRQIMDKWYGEACNELDSTISLEEKLRRLPFYMDTDSLNVPNTALKQYGGTIEIDKSLGGIDDDVGGKIIQGIWVRPKCYMFKYLAYDKDRERYCIKRHYRCAGVPSKYLTDQAYEAFDVDKSYDFYREFDIQKIGYRMSTKEIEMGYNHFSHRHIKDKEKLKKVINETSYAGRLFGIDKFGIKDERNSGFSLPIGHKLTLTN